MRNSIKWTAVLSAAAVMASMAFGFSSTALAQNAGWVQEEGTWRYYDSDGYALTDSWRKSGDFWYYLDENGRLAQNRQIDEYYVDAEGRRVSDRWVSVVNEDDWSEEAPELIWFYYGSNGKMVTSKFKEIDGAVYYFDEDGRMAVGLTEIDGGNYYFASGGAMVKGWLELPADTDDYSDEMAWSYFDSHGKRVENQLDKKIGGGYYTFADGRMITGWYKLPETAAAADAEEAAENAADTEEADGNAAGAEDADGNAAGAEDADGNAAGAEDADGNAADAEDADENAVTAPAAGYQYYEESGRRAAGWLTIAGIPGVSEEDEAFRFYFKNGVPHYSVNGGIQVFGIGSDRYAFNDRGEMQTGLTVVTLDDGSTANYYFGENGAMKTGKQTIFDEDTEMNQSWYFQTEGSARGQGFHGIRGNSIYSHGLRLDADSDLRYAPVTFEGQKYLVNASGTIQKASSSSRSAERADLGAGYRDVRDANDTVWTVDVNGIIR